MNNHQKLSIVICLTLMPVFLYGLNYWFRKGGAVKSEAIVAQVITPLLTTEVTITTIPTITPIPTDHTIPTAIPTNITPASDQTDWEQFDKEMKQSAEELKQSKEELDRIFGPQSSSETSTSTSEPTPTPTFQQANGPRFVTWTDSVGNTFTNSFNYYYQGWEQSMIASTAVSISAHPTMSFTVTANDPNGRPIQYMFMTSGSGGQIQNYSSNNSYTANVIGSPGTYFRVVARIKNDDAYLSYDSGGSQVDAGWWIDYNLVP